MGLLPQHLRQRRPDCAAGVQLRLGTTPAASDTARGAPDRPQPGRPPRDEPTTIDLYVRARPVHSCSITGAWADTVPAPRRAQRDRLEVCSRRRGDLDGGVECLHRLLELWSAAAVRDRTHAVARFAGRLSSFLTDAGHLACSGRSHALRSDISGARQGGSDLCSPPLGRANGRRHRGRGLCSRLATVGRSPCRAAAMATRGRTTRARQPPPWVGPRRGVA